MSGIGIDVRGLSKRFGRSTALQRVAMSFEAGMLHGLIGPNGAGKTTLLRLIVGLLRPNEGEVVFFRDGATLALADVRPLISYMPQRATLYDDLSIGEHLDFFADLYGLAEDVYSSRRRELLAIARLESFVDRPAGQLSGGMYKKLGLMCVLLQSPSILLLDEPTNGVDPISRRELWDLLYRLTQDSGVTVVLATSYMDEAERCARIHLIERGQVVAEGDPRDVLELHKAASLDALFLAREGLTK